jgi:hypothetical protein
MNIKLTTRELRFILDGLVMLFDDLPPCDAREEIIRIHDDLDDVVMSGDPDHSLYLEQVLKGNFAARVSDDVGNDPLDW